MSTCPPVQAQPTAAREDVLAGLCAILQVTWPGADAELIRRSYDVAAFWHRDQRRKSGDPYITHPLAVATILAGTGADDDTLAQAMTVTGVCRYEGPPDQNRGLLDAAGVLPLLSVTYLSSFIFPMP